MTAGNVALILFVGVVGIWAGANTIAGGGWREKLIGSMLLTGASVGVIYGLSLVSTLSR
jgi:hypothetical protein